MPKVKIIKIVHGLKYSNGDWGYEQSDGEENKWVESEEWEDITQTQYAELVRSIMLYGEQKDRLYVLVVKRDKTDEAMTANGFIEWGRGLEREKKRRATGNKKRAEKVAITKAKKQEEKERKLLQSLSEKYT